MGWSPLSWFRRSSEPDYESLLSQLEASIKAREDHLLSIRLRERRANALFITYGLGAWLVYLLLWYFRILARGDGLERVMRAAPVVGGPVAIICTRRVLAVWYKRKQDAEQTTLRALKKSQREKVEELKKKTGYYSTRNLLEKYDEVIRKNAETRRPGSSTPVDASAPATPSTPSRAASQPRKATRSNPGSPQISNVSLAAAGSMSIPPPQHLPLLPPAPSTPVPRTLIDKLADALLGVSTDDGGPNSKYALICAQCFSHNGLVVKEEFDTIQYGCPRCGHFNPSRKSQSPDDKPSRLSGQRRRVQSMHHTSSPALVDRPERREPTEDSEAVEDEGEATLLPEAAVETKGRRRASRRQEDAMDES